MNNITLMIMLAWLSSHYGGL